MRPFAFFILLLPLQRLEAQPLNGNYTVGGASPDFATLQDAASAVKPAGVSGPVFFNIRPGTYMKDAGVSTVFVLDSSIAGVSPINRITFQPDASSGGNVNNVILQADFDISSNRHLVVLQADYVTLRDLTFKDADSMDTPVGYFIFAGFDPNNIAIDGLEIHNCTFLGTPYSAAGFGSDIGIGSFQNLASATFTNNRFYRILRGITNENGSVRGGTIVVEGNEFYQGYEGATGTGNQLGLAIELACTDASVRRNIIDFAGGAGGGVGGIRVISVTSAVIERNLIMNRFAVSNVGFTGLSVTTPFFPFFPVDSILIANNAIVANRGVQESYGMYVTSPNTRILFNTIVNAGGAGGNNIALVATGDNGTVLNNIILEMSAASFVAVDFGSALQALNLVSDYNIFLLPLGRGASGFIRHGGTLFTSLGGYQAGSGLDSNSDSTTVLFSDLFHLDECQAQDSDLNGIPVPGITADYDGAGRDPVVPFKGADEAVRIPFDMFADGFRAGTGGAPFSVAAGDFFDNDNDDDIAVPDYDNRRILLFRNQRPARSFVQSTILLPNVQPGVIKLFDFDEDGILDLIAAGDTTAVDVFWGTSGGGFDPPVTVGTTGRVRSIEPEPFRKRSDGATIWLTEDNGFLPNTGFLGSVICFAARQLCHDLTYREAQPFYIHDTIPYTITALAAADIDTTPGYEVVTLTVPSHLLEFRDLTAKVFGPPLPCDPGYANVHDEYQFGTGSYLGFGSNIIIGDFDGDVDKDIITTSSSENTCVLVQNLGNVMLTLGDSIPTTQTRAIVALDYENDGDLDFVAANRTLYENGITVFLNDGLGNFTAKPNCFFPFANGFPNGMVATDFDLDGKTDIAIASSFDSLFVLYNLGGLNEPPPTALEELELLALPRQIALAPNYPNPFNPSTNIRFEVSAPGFVSLKVYNILGQEVVTLVNDHRSPGRYEVAWQPRGLASGVYFYRLQAGGVFETRKLMLLK